MCEQFLNAINDRGYTLMVKGYTKQDPYYNYVDENKEIAKKEALDDIELFEALYAYYDYKYPPIPETYFYTPYDVNEYSEYYLFNMEGTLVARLKFSVEHIAAMENADRERHKEEMELYQPDPFEDEIPVDPKGYKYKDLHREYWSRKGKWYEKSTIEEHSNNVSWKVGVTKDEGKYTNYYGEVVKYPSTSRTNKKKKVRKQWMLKRKHNKEFMHTA